MTEFVVDASVALKWFVPETDSDLAEQLLVSGTKLHAPRFLALETVNAAWKNWRKKLIDRAVVELAGDRLPALIEVWHADEDLMHEALDLALDLNHPIFDCIYLVAARRIGGTVITADKRLLGIAPDGLAVALEEWGT